VSERLLSNRPGFTAHRLTAIYLQSSEDTVGELFEGIKQAKQIKENTASEKLIMKYHPKIARMFCEYFW
jgi:hypothetical protein